MSVREGDKVCFECGGVNEHKDGCSGQSDREFAVLSVDSRDQAISDGVLVDCAQPPFDELNQNAGIKVHVAMTVEAFDAYVHPLGVASSPIATAQHGSTWELAGESAQAFHLPPGQDMKGRYWDIVWMLRLAMLRQRDSSCVLFRLYVVPNGGGKQRLVQLKCVAGPDDEGDVCLTIMFPGQD